MPRTVITPAKATGGYSYAGVNLPMAPADVTNKNFVHATGKDLVVAHNTGSVAATVTITSYRDAYGRVGDISAYSVPAGEVAVFGPFPKIGWAQPGAITWNEPVVHGLVTVQVPHQADAIYCEASVVDVLLGVIHL